MVSTDTGVRRSTPPALSDPTVRRLVDITVSIDMGVRRATAPLSRGTAVDMSLMRGGRGEASVSMETGVMSRTGACRLSPMAGEELYRAGEEPLCPDRGTLGCMRTDGLCRMRSLGEADGVLASLRPMSRACPVGDPAGSAADCSHSSQQSCRELMKL
mmetsp:Transcript_53993/g.167344  ORF Transcript_53993/g.167344 Transcript_53993/m.167344 type:complete len:158 (+) Transcript_53993:505-978(+)